MNVEIKGMNFRIKGWYLFAACLVLVLVVMFPNFQWRISGDCYKYAISYYWLPGVYFYVGRYFVSLIYMIITRALGINPVLNQLYFMIIYVLILAFGSYLLMITFLRLTKINKLSFIAVSLLAVTSIFVNYFFQEAFAHTHAWISFMAAKLLTSLSIWCFFRYEKKKGILLSAVILLLALWSYQSFYQIYLIVCLSLCIIQLLCNHDKRLFAWSSIKILIITATTTVISYLSIRVGTALGFLQRWSDFPRPPIHETIRDTLHGFLMHFAHVFSLPRLGIGWALRHSFFMYPVSYIGLLVMFILAASAFVIAYMIINRHRTLTVLSVVALFFVIIFGTFASGILTGLGAAPTFRTIVGLTAGVPVMALIFITIRHKEDVKTSGRIVNKYALRVVYVAILFGFISNMHILQTFSINQVANNRIDENFARIVYAEIVRHEESTGTTINYVSMSIDAQGTFFNNGIPLQFFVGEFNLRALVLAYGIDVLNYVSGRSFTPLHTSEAMHNELFGNNDWSTLIVSEQLVFIGNTLFWVHF